MDTITAILVSGMGAVAVGLSYSLLKREPTPKSQINDKEPALGNVDTLFEDDIVAVRKKTLSETENLNESFDKSPKEHSNAVCQSAKTVTAIHVMAKKDHKFSGHLLLQTLLSHQLRFGEMNIFHRYQGDNGQGPVMFSLASATEPGTFDINNMGAFPGKGLTLFMRLSGNQTIDKERFDLMTKTARSLAEKLGGQLYDNHRNEIAFDETISYA